MTYTSQLWIHSEKRRYYRASLYQDLLGDWVLLRDWGALDSRLGGIKTELLTGLKEGEEKLLKIAKRRKQHHYHIAEQGQLQGNQH
ncbi:MAG: hypothetical protein ACPGSM_17985 [Thiolinea sp.]